MPVVEGGGGSGGGGSQTELVDLGIIDLVSLVTDGPQTLHTLAVGEFLASVRFADVDAVQMNDAPAYAAFGIGTLKSFGWSTFALLFTKSVAPGANALTGSIDTLSMGAAGVMDASSTNWGSGYGPMAAIDDSAPDPLVSAQVLSAPSAGVIQAAWCWPTQGTWQSPGGGGWRMHPETWQPNHAYDFYLDGASAPGDFLAIILADDHYWLNVGTAGTSASSEPDFAGNIGGSVADGANIVWFDLGSAPTSGQVHAIAEIWTP